MRSIHSPLGAAAVLAASSALPPAQISSFTLEEMVREADQVIHGQVIGARVFRVDSPIDGDELYYTTITIQARLLASGQTTTVDVTFRGGFLSVTEGVFNSEAPPIGPPTLTKNFLALDMVLVHAGSFVIPPAGWLAVHLADLPDPALVGASWFARIFDLDPPRPFQVSNDQSITLVP